MLPYRSIFRFTIWSNRIVLHKNQALLYSKSSSSDTSTSSDDESAKKKISQKEVKKERSNSTAINKLNSLLQQMVQDDTNRTLDLAKPKNYIKKKPSEKPATDVSESLSDPSEKQIIAAAKLAAKSVGGDVKQTESELLAKLLSPVVEEENENSKASNLSDIIVGMKIDRTNKEKISSETSRAHQVRQFLKHSGGVTKSKEGRDQRRISRNREVTQTMLTERIDLFGSDRLGIFSPEKKATENEIVNKTWEELEKRELKLAITHPPSNYFQQMIMWTEQGKLWKFPIDNEQDMHNEKDVYFADHVFLERHLEPWCPKQGPIRHFMELVCVGLSKNPYISVQNKRDHIEWFQKYFLDKIQLLREIGAIPAETKDDQTVENVKSE